MKLGKLLAAAFAVALLAGCAGPQSSTGKNFLCAVGGALAGGAAGAAIDDSETAAGGAVAGAIIGMLVCPQDSSEPVEAPVCAMEPVPGATLDANGCAYDSDSDGVVDGIDACPNTPAGVTVDSVGCPLDSDSDGVADYLDLCPGTPAGVEVDADGCPTAGSNILSLTGVNFDFDKATLTAEAKDILQEAVTLLKETDSVVEVRVEGHTDSTGPEAYNMNLSQRRAESVVDYLASQGVDSNNLIPVGLGETSPVATNDTVEGRAANRRVDFVVNQ
jgi:OOP family OmpA-OmpF porin